MQLKAHILFNEKPKKWGLRGDPFLWADLKNAFLEVSLPCSKEESTIKIQENFLELTGHNLDENNNFYVENIAKAVCLVDKYALEFGERN